ncbi:DUF1320 domain-containing protein [Segnochrobactrum spirostomi]|uniref:DUF1320 domain-containing protein n=1 Tax=Segnochrobactrum spirostomi TaxID=2608987 RepID=A0A6A7Y8T9_9HYPH|nr:DUF1320 domain-containing protein [Segnochrobactrum spirostomi]MQT14391.1 DUF1320 domain-containing protein [Segnochrobactrum spirostomi]
MTRATIDDLVRRYGEGEICTAASPGSETPASVADLTAAQRARIEGALGDADALIDGYVRRRYALPITPEPPELIRAACVLARSDLATGTDLVGSEAMRLARKEVTDWLGRLADGAVSLAVPDAAGAAGASGARVSDRPREIETTGLRG